ncbi:hypothetical protein FC093_07300 [Ilyomonas limi]|uniref:Uncharacterized protein n=1 Tax=Ilyomonas limi TaxID=2575867 RepID=A0A4U3L677_9BACT|nr:hypothetical protein [Ilyomonas limi]TKK69874.1 hypothetical protein FC093_07300 [Ilyomonas limi]
MDYQKEFNEMLNSLKACPNVTVTEEDFFVKEEIIPSFFKKYKHLKIIEEEIKVLNDNKIVWGYTQASGNTLPMGETHLISIEKIISTKSKLEVRIRNSEAEEILAELLPFDDHPNAGDGIMGCLRWMNDQYEIWLCDAHLNCFKMNFGLSEYLKKLIELKAMYGWQYLFAELDIKSDAFKVIRKELKNRLTILHKCFPNLPVDSYLKKL